MPDVLTMGTLDGMHVGHIGLLNICRIIAGTGRVTVGVNTSEFILRFKHRPPIFTTDERRIMVGANRNVDRVLVNDGTDQPALIVEAFGDSGGVLIVGDDWAPPNDYLAQIGLADDRGFLTVHGVILAFVPRTGDWSSTELRTRLVM